MKSILEANVKLEKLIEILTFFPSGLNRVDLELICSDKDSPLGSLSDLEKSLDTTDGKRP